MGMGRREEVKEAGIAPEALGGRCFERLLTEWGRGGNKREMATPECVFTVGKKS